MSDERGGKKERKILEIRLWQRNFKKISRGRAVWQLVWLITRRSQVQILPPQQKRLYIDLDYLKNKGGMQ